MVGGNESAKHRPKRHGHTRRAGDRLDVSVMGCHAIQERRALNVGASIAPMIEFAWRDGIAFQVSFEVNGAAVLFFKHLGLNAFLDGLGHFFMVGQISRR